MLDNLKKKFIFELKKFLIKSLTFFNNISFFFLFLPPFFFFWREENADQRSSFIFAKKQKIVSPFRFFILIITFMFPMCMPPKNFAYNT